MLEIKRYIYNAFGLRVLSDIHLPELPDYCSQEDTDIEEVEIKIDDLSKIWSEIGIQGKFVVKGNLVIFRISNTAIFCIQDGKYVFISPIKGSDMDKIRLYLLGTCMGIILLQKNIIPLHGSAVAINGKAYAFIGESGAGKSTLASEFVKRGFRILSDDVIALSLSYNQIPFVIPSYPQQKLWQESLEYFGMETIHYRPLFERETKYSIPIHEDFFSEPLPLAGIFELVKLENENVEILPIKGLQRFHTLFYHTYRSFLIKRLGLLQWHLDVSTNIINHIDFYQLQRPLSSFTANQLSSLVLSTLNKEEYV